MTSDALEESEERYRFLSEAIPVQIWTALPDGSLDYVSDQTAHALGLTPERLLADGWQNVVHPDDLPRAVTHWTDALATGATYEVEFRLKIRGGEYTWHLARAVPQRNASGTIVRWFGTNTNIEEQRAHQRQIEALLVEGEERTAQLREQNQLLALDAEVGAVLAHNGALRDALQTCAEAVVRHLDAAFARIWTAHEAEALLELQASAGLYTHLDGPHARVPVGQFKIGRIAARRAPHFTNTVVGDPEIGDQGWAVREGMTAFAGYPILFGDKLVGVIAAFARHPFSEARIAALGGVANALAQSLERRHLEGEKQRVEAERARLLEQEQRARRDADAALVERERLLAIAEAARRRAEVASRAKDDFLATASHELRTPLNAILGWARLLRGGNLEHSAFLRGLETIERNANAQVQLIEDILDGSRVVTGNLHLEIRPLNMQAVVNAALDAVRPSATAKGIAIAVDLDPEAAHIKGDPDRLQQVVWNLVNNAIKFTPKGGRIAIRLERVGTSIDLSVKDSGQGIDSGFLPQVFDRFRQADESTTRRHGGLGLGLALVRHLVEAHGGTARAESAGLGQGATFTVTLPVIAVRAKDTPVGRETPTNDARLAARPDPLRGIRVLVVDDEPDARDLVAAVLRTRGAEVLLAASVPEALELIVQRAPNILVSDIGMPVTDGYGLIQRVRALDASASRLPAIALTAYAREEDRRRALQAGFQSYLSKPVEPEALVQLVGEFALKG